MSRHRSVIPEKLKAWIDARDRYKLSHAQVQMARELGMNPKKLGSLANQKQEQWKAPLPEFIEQCYLKQFKKSAPKDNRPIEQKLEAEHKKTAVQGSGNGE
jgi:hypothetical protein